MTDRPFVAHQPFLDVETFLTNGGYIKRIQSPTEETVAPYIKILDDLQEGNTDTELATFYSVSKYGFKEASKPDAYNTPELLLTFDAEHNYCGLLFIYKVIDQGDPFVWGEAWASNPHVVGAGSLLSLMFTDIADQLNLDLYGNPALASPRMVNALEHRSPYFIKDPTTKWFKVTVAEYQEHARTLMPQMLQCPNLMKFIPPFPYESGNPFRYDWNTDTWVDIVVNPDVDLGTPIELAPDTFYSFDYDTKKWVANA